MSNSRRQSGMTLIELIVAIVIVSVGLAGMLAVFQTVVRSSADPMVRKQMLAVAEGLMEEITLKPYAGSAVTPSGCARSGFGDVDDYNGYASSGICDPDGNALPGLAAYAVAVTVTPDTLAGVGQARRIAVTVTRAPETLTLVSWRTDWACTTRDGGGACIDP
ncbi:MAG: prepilin-type N-terminal cleavage/methylation domain-containing protein [Dechloromonas sp.]|nr:MAG: prepilin-type N-terminal cleavage/methylation domain-containing protein [Dechloromonas sp.]